MRCVVLALLVSLAGCNEARPNANGPASAAPSPSASVSASASASPIDEPDPRVPNVPAVRVANVTVTGGLAPDVVRPIVESKLGHLRACFTMALMGDQMAGGQVESRFFIHPDGKTHDLKSTTKGSQELANCTRQALAGLEYPKPANAAMVALTTTFERPAYKFEIGQASVHVSLLNVKLALEVCGYIVTGVPTSSLAKATLSSFTAEKGGARYSFTLDPRAELPLARYRQLKQDAVSLEDGAWALFVESNDKAASQAVIDCIHVKLPADGQSTATR